MQTVDCVVVGAGVVGLAVARALTEAGIEVIVLETNREFGQETSSRNSEVIHAGLYYPPGSLKASLCVTGRDLLYAYAEAKGVAHRRLGKLIVAVEADELAALDTYVARAQACGAGELARLTPAEVAELEPDIVCAAALLSPLTGVVDAHEFMLSMVGDLERKGGLLAFESPFEAAVVGKRGTVVSIGGPGAMELRCRWLVNSAGLAAPTVASAIEGLEPKHVPPAFYAVGHYYNLSGRSPFRRLIYPVGNAAGLGVHVTLDMSGQARFGPDVRWIDAIDYNFDDSQREAFVAAVRRYYPGIEHRELVPGYTGIRPKIVGPGQPAADFRIDGPDLHGVPGLINLFGIESPGLTAALAIGDYVVSMVHETAVFG